MEGQTANSALVQAPYDAVFGENEVCVLAGWEALRTLPGVQANTIGYGWRSKHRHPLLDQLGETIKYEGNGRIPEDVEIYENVPPGVKPKTGNNASDGETERNLRFTPGIGRHKGISYGWFTSWGKAWIPLLKENTIGAPILLAKTEGKGLLLASTMWMSASQVTVASRIAELAVDENLRKEVLRYHRKRVLYRRIADIGVAVIAAALVIAALWGLAWVWGAALDAENHVGAIALSVFGVGVLTVMATAWNRYRIVWSRPFGVGWYRQVLRRRNRL